jgi:hypothetical protein
MVINDQGSDTDRYMEVGILPQIPNHFFRLHIVKNCVLETVMMFKADDAAKRPWEINVLKPVGKGITLDWEGADFKRRTHKYPKDFRWLLDFEDDKLHGNLYGKLHTSILTPVIRVKNGMFGTRLKSRRLKLLKNEAEVDSDFGNICVALACDIKVQIDEPQLESGEPIVVAELKAKGKTIFGFKIHPSESHTIYEIVNSPSDTYVPSKLHMPHDHGATTAANDLEKAASFNYHLTFDDPNVSTFRIEVEHHPSASHEHCATSEPEAKADGIVDHTKHYYAMFDPSVKDRFSFEEQSGQSGPRPTLCGMVLLGSREGDL